MALACKYCIITKGLRGSELDSLPQNSDELLAHIEKEHHVVVRRKNETDEQATERFLRENPDARTCEECVEAKAPWIQSA